MRSVVKRSHPRSRRAASRRVTPDEESVTMSREGIGYGCSLAELWEAEIDRTCLDPVPRAVARPLARVGPSRTEIVAPTAETPRLTRATVERRRMGMRAARSILPDEARGWTWRTKVRQVSRDDLRRPGSSNGRPSRGGRQASLTERVNPPGAGEASRGAERASGGSGESAGAGDPCP